MWYLRKGTLCLGIRKDRATGETHNCKGSFRNMEL